MPLDPDAETLLAMMREAGRPPMETLTPEQAREGFKAGRAVVQPDPQDVAEVRDLSCTGPHGPIPLRAYRPARDKAGRSAAGAGVLPWRRLAAGGSRIPMMSHAGITPMRRSAAWCRSITVWRRSTNFPPQSMTVRRRPAG